jgi:hypothetical protein
MSDTQDDLPSNKVARLLREYELDGIGEELEARWTADGDERMSLRDLASYFNKRLLERRLTRAGLSTLEADAETTYRNLTSDDVSAGVRSDTRVRLQQNGVDVDALEQDFVTYQAIRSYLKEYREATYQQASDEKKIAKDKESIKRLVSRTRSVTADRLEKLSETDRIAIDDFEILLDMQVLCQECGSQYSVDELLDARGCSCQQER